METIKNKMNVSEKLRQACDGLSAKQRKGVLVGILIISTILCGITVTRALGRFLAPGNGNGIELPYGNDSTTYHSKFDK